MPRALEDRVAVITGAGRGIGAAIAREFTAAGAKLVLAARTESELSQVAEACRSSGGTASACVTDVAVPEDVQRLVAAALERHGRIDILANVAGTYGPIGRLEDIDLAGWRQVLDVNLMGTLHTSQAVL